MEQGFSRSVGFLSRFPTDSPLPCSPGWASGHQPPTSEMDYTPLCNQHIQSFGNQEMARETTIVGKPKSSPGPPSSPRAERMKIKVYIAGPMRGLPAFNFPAFHAAASTLRALGFHVFSPAEFDTIFSPISEDPAGQLEAHPIHDYIRRDTHVIINELKPPHDGLVLLPNWESSVGAVAEQGLARWCQLNIWRLEDLL